MLLTLTQPILKNKAHKVMLKVYKDYITYICFDLISIDLDVKWLMALSLEHHFYRDSDDIF